MNILRATIRTPATHSRLGYNRYTGGMGRRSTLSHPPSRYGRAFSTSAEEVREEVDDIDPRDLEDPATLEAIKDQQILILGEKISEMKSNWQRSLAETDNITKKMHKDVGLARDQSTEKMVRQLLVVSDTLDFCLKNKPNFESPELKDNSEAKGAFDGLEASKKHFIAAMKSVNVSEILPQLGNTFDPMLHNACFEIESEDAPGQIGLVIKSGWAKENTLLRAADVGVTKSKNIPVGSENIEGKENEPDSDDETK